jgi:hypothetical protein
MFVHPIRSSVLAGTTRYSLSRHTARLNLTPRFATRRFNATDATGSTGSAAIPPQTPKSSPFKRVKTVAKFTGYLCLSSILGVLAVGGALFVHDAFTYSEKHVDRVPVSPLALNPERGGPKNLPIVRVQVDDQDDEENRKLASKPRLVIVGGGWGVCSLQ